MRPRETVGAGRETQKGQPRSAKTKPSRAEDSLPDSTQAHYFGATSTRPSTKPVVGAAAKAAPATTERKEETKKEAQDAKDAKHKMPAREPIRMRRAKTWDVEVENAYRFQCAGWRSAVRDAASRGAAAAIETPRAGGVRPGRVRG